MSKIKVNEIEAATGSTVTIPTGQTFSVVDGIPATNLSGTIADARLPTVPVSKGGTGLTSLGSAGQVVKVNSGGNALEFGAEAGGAQTLLASGTSTNQTQIVFDSSLITTTYQIYNLYFTAGARNNQDMRVYYSSDNGSNYVNVDRFYEHIQLHSGGGDGTGIAQSDVNNNSGMIITKNNVAGDIAQGLITVYKPNVSGGSSARWNKGAMHSRVITQQNPGSSVNIEELRGVAIASQSATTNTFVVNNFKIFTTGNFDIRYALYGLKLGS